MGTVWKCLGMMMEKYYFLKKRIGLEDRKVGNVGKGMHGNVRGSLGMLGNVGER